MDHARQAERGLAAVAQRLAGARRDNAASAVEKPRARPTDPAIDSTALARRAMAGERDAFGALYERHVDRVFGYVRFRVGDADTAADLTQDVFVNAFRGITKLQHPERLGAWLIQIAHNRVLNHRRARSRKLGQVDWPEDADDFADEPETESDPARAAELTLTADRLAVAARGLTEMQQQVIALRFVGGLSLVETAEALGRSDDAVKKLQRRALAMLRRHLNDGEDGP